MKAYSLLLSILLIALLVAGWLGFKHYQNKIDGLNKSNQELNMKADLAIGRANTWLESPDKHIKDLAPEIQKDIKDRGGKLDTIGNIKANYTVRNNGTLEVPPPVVLHEVGEKCNIVSTPFTYQDFRLFATGDATKKTFTYLLSQKFEVTFAETKLKNGAINNYAELYELDNNNKRVGKMQLSDFKVIKSPIDPKKFKWWDPAVDILAGGIVTKDYTLSFNGNVGFSFFSYGRYKNLDWRFLRLGVGIDKAGLEFSLSPIQYNFAQPVPLINNLWITPQIGWQLDTKNYFLGMGIAAVL